MLDDPQDVPGIEPGRAATTRPRSLPAPGDADTAAGTFVDVANRTTLNRHQGRANFLQRCARQLGHAIRDPVVPVLGVSAAIAVEVIAHMDELFRHDDLQCPGLAPVDTGEVDEDRVDLALPEVAVGAAVGRGNASPQPSAVGVAVGRDPERIGWKGEQRDVSLDERDEVVVALVENHWFQTRFSPAGGRAAPCATAERQPCGRI